MPIAASGLPPLSSSPSPAFKRPPIKLKLMVHLIIESIAVAADDRRRAGCVVRHQLAIRNGLLLGRERCAEHEPLFRVERGRLRLRRRGAIFTFESRVMAENRVRV